MAVAPAAGAAAGAATEAALLALALLALLVWAIAYGMRGAWVHTIGWALVEVAHLLRHIPLGVGSYLESQVLAVNDTVLNTFVTIIAGSDALVGYLFHWMATLFTWMIRETVAVTHDTLAWAEHLQNVHLPNYVKWAIRAAVPPWLIYSLARKAVAAELPQIRRLVHSTTHDVTVITARVPAELGREVGRDHKTLTRLAAVVAGIAGGLVWPHGVSLPGIGPVWRGLTRRLARIERRLARIEALLGVTGMAVAVANMLGIANPRCLTKGPLGKVSRALCGIGGQALDDLLGLLVDVLLVEDVCKVVQLLEDGLQIIQGPVDAIVGEVGGSLCHGDYLPPPYLGPMALSLPPVSGLGSLGV